MATFHRLSQGAAAVDALLHSRGPRGPPDPRLATSRCFGTYGPRRALMVARASEAGVRSDRSGPKAAATRGAGGLKIVAACVRQQERGIDRRRRCFTRGAGACGDRASLSELVLSVLSQAHVEPDLSLEIFFVDGARQQLSRAGFHGGSVKSGLAQESRRPSSASRQITRPVCPAARRSISRLAR